MVRLILSLVIFFVLRQYIIYLVEVCTNSNKLLNYLIVANPVRKNYFMITFENGVLLALTFC